MRFILLIFSIFFFFSSSNTHANTASQPETEALNHKNSKPRISERKIAQRRGYGYRPRYRNNYNNQLQQQRLRQQRLQQQRLQRQRMQEQRRLQQARQRKMLEQRRRQQAAMRARQRQIRLQRQRTIEKRRLAQQKRRNELSRLQSQRSNTQQRQESVTQRTSKAPLIEASRLRRLQALRRRVKQQQNKNGHIKNNAALSLASSLKNTKPVSTFQNSKLNSRINTVRSNLNALKANKIRLKGVEKATNNLTKNTKKIAALTANLKRCNGLNCTTCSFHGDTQVLTSDGFVAIRNILPGIHKVWSKSEINSTMNWKPIISKYSNAYRKIVHVTVKDIQTGHKQTIRSNRIHPFFVQIPKSQTLMQLTSIAQKNLVPSSTENRYYEGEIENGYWIDAAHLKPGYRLLNADKSWSKVVNIITEQRSLKAYNLTVSGFHTYFVRSAANDNAKPVWVHNNCNDTVLQTGKNIIKSSTARALGLTRQQARDALHKIKKDNLLRNDHHGKIMSNGDYVDSDTGEIYGNIKDEK